MPMASNLVAEIGSLRPLPSILLFMTVLRRTMVV